MHLCPQGPNLACKTSTSGTDVHKSENPASLWLHVQNVDVARKSYISISTLICIPILEAFYLH